MSSHLTTLVIRSNQALQGYAGTLILVTHDRRLFETVGIDRVVDVAAGVVSERP